MIGENRLFSKNKQNKCCFMEQIQAFVIRWTSTDCYTLNHILSGLLHAPSKPVFKYLQSL
jgi:hypothetical protein